jgi:hypothetical protein
MNTFLRLLLATFTILTVTASAIAQTPVGIVNRYEVQRLAALDTPSASRALARHFAALSESYAAEAARYTSMAGAYSAVSPRIPVNDTPAYCRRMAAQATNLAAAADEMVIYLRLLAEGIVAPAPKEASMFLSGEGAPEPTPVDLHLQAVMARTPADHRALAEYYTKLAVRNTAAAKTHDTMAHSYRAGVFKNVGNPADHYNRRARQARQAAKEATEAAARQYQLANVG